ncbi:hypothetical protein TWF225_006938 [Orbilia oligospora]|uniref:DUF4246 domain-containing protein n=1 Tax=Orbilia oligospora TaxID=2813651 RepID=A0A8H2HTK5_ORBOL|nr:hypothetical protein TWF225_006938 [Orbilia oligospora]TGJ68567.1 hypothetical protein EYR41_007611 [Orbilia oligospora]
MSGSCPEDNFRPPGYDFKESNHDHPNTNNYDQWRTSTVQVPYGGYPLSSQFLISAGLYESESGSGFPNIQLPLKPPQPINYMFRFPPQPLPQNPFPPGYSDAKARFSHPSDENISEGQKDWHPNSNNQVLNLVHPSLWPIIYNVTIDSSGNPLTPPNGKKGWTSKYFCWLPSEFEICSNGETKVASYINNLSTPEQKDLFYPILGRIFDKFMPLFNHVLANLKEGFYDRERVERDYCYVRPEELSQKDHDRRWERLLKQFEERKYLLIVRLHGSEPEDDYYGFLDDEDKQQEGVDNEIDLGHEEESDCEDQYECGQDYYTVRNMGDVLDQRMWRPPKPKTLNDVQLEDTTAHVIVKMANIILTPDKTEYTGGTWHMEAMENERIVSTGIYYYS